MIGFLEEINMKKSKRDSCLTDGMRQKLTFKPERTADVAVCFPSAVE